MGVCQKEVDEMNIIGNHICGNDDDFTIISFVTEILTKKLCQIFGIAIV